MRKTVFLIAILFISFSINCCSQQLYLGIDAGFDKTTYNRFGPDFNYSGEIKCGKTFNNPKWQIEAGFRRNFDISFLNFVSCVPLSVRYNLKFLFLQGGYCNFFRNEDGVYFDTSTGYYVATSDYNLKYSPGYFFALGIDKNINSQFILNMKMRFSGSFDEWGYLYDKGHFVDEAFLVGIEYHFKGKKSG